MELIDCEFFAGDGESVIVGSDGSATGYGRGGTSSAGGGRVVIGQPSAADLFL